MSIITVNLNGVITGTGDPDYHVIVDTAPAGVIATLRKSDIREVSGIIEAIKVDPNVAAISFTAVDDVFPGIRNANILAITQASETTAGLTTTISGVESYLRVSNGEALIKTTSSPVGTAGLLAVDAAGLISTYTGGVGAGTVTAVSVASANGFTGTVANSSTTPAITIATSITGILKGNGTAISAATEGTDYVRLASSLTGLSITGSSITSANTIISAFGALQNQINGILGGAIYQGIWNATTNSPALADGTGVKGQYYVVSVAGTQNLGSGAISFDVGDWAIHNGTIYQKVDNTDAVSSVNGAIGAVTVTVTGTANRITVTGGSGLAPTVDISSSYVGQNTITTLGTITTGTLGSGSKILVGSDATGDFYYNGGSGIITRLAAGAAGTFIRFAGAGIAPTVSSLVLPNSATANYIVYATSSNTYGENSKLTYDGTALSIDGAANTGWQIRSLVSSAYSALYNGSVTPSPTNYTIAGNGSSTNLNGTGAGGVFLTISGATVFSVTSATSVALANAVNIVFNTSTGSKIGTATGQKIAFWNKTPIIQPTTAITGATLVSNAGTALTSTDTFGGYTMQQLAAIIINTGLAA